MENKQPSKLKFALNYGAMLGLVLIIMHVVSYLLGVNSMESKPYQYLGYAVLIAALVYAIKVYRDRELGGAITYGQAVGTGFLVGLFGGIIAAVYMYSFISFVDNSMLEQIVAQTEQQMIDQGLSDEQMEASLEMTKKFVANPVMIFIIGVLTYAVMSIVFSLIIAIFMKKEGNTFFTDTEDTQQPQS